MTALALPPMSMRCPPNQLVMATRTIPGRLIRIFLKWNHIEMFRDEGHCVGATWPCVRKAPFVDVLKGTIVYCVVAPPGDWEAAPDRNERFMRYCRYLDWLAETKVRYDGVSWARRIQADGRVCCSEAGAYAWDELLCGLWDWHLPGHRLVMPTPDHISPATV